MHKRFSSCPMCFRSLKFCNSQFDFGLFIFRFKASGCLLGVLVVSQECLVYSKNADRRKLYAYVYLCPTDFLSDNMFLFVDISQKSIRVRTFHKFSVPRRLDVSWVSLLCRKSSHVPQEYRHAKIICICLHLHNRFSSCPMAS